MTFKAYLKDRKIFIIVNLLFFLGGATVLGVLDVYPVYILIMGLLWFAPLFGYMGMEYMKFKRYIEPLMKTVRQLEPKYLLGEVVESPDFLEGQLIHECLRMSHHAMLEEVKKQKKIQKEYKEYIETWVHEIKTPIASIGLVTHNEDNELTRKIAYETRRIENYVEQVLYYARSSEVKTDYLIKPFILRQVVLEVVKQYKTDFIRSKIGIELGDLSEVVYSDRKWIAFMVSQLMSNAIKYSGGTAGKVLIYSETGKHQVVLTIEDQGVGISSKEQSRVFDKGFTGENGRKYGKSTGIGLYLCKQLCDKLGLGISLTSEENMGTRVQIIFPIGDKIECLKS